MKKVIKGKLYDTDKARLMGSYEYTAEGWGFNYYKEELYQKRSGEFFLYGEGGPASKYSEPAGLNCWTGSADIIPLDYQSAREWAEENLSADAYESIFGVIEEDDSKIMVNFYIESSTWEMAKQAAHSQGISIADYLDTIIKTANKR